LDGSGALVGSAIYGPFRGWFATAISGGADSFTRVLWNKVDGSTGLSFFGSGILLATYRYDAVEGWTAVDVAVGADGQTRILWTNGEGRMALWRVNNSGNPTARVPSTKLPSDLPPAALRRDLTD
jgi:hypothetical protein